MPPGYPVDRAPEGGHKGRRREARKGRQRGVHKVGPQLGRKQVVYVPPGLRLLRSKRRLAEGHHRRLRRLGDGGL